MGLAAGVMRDHSERVNAADLGGGEALQQAVLAIVVHQKPNGSAVHAVDRDLVIDEAMQGLQH